MQLTLYGKWKGSYPVLLHISSLILFVASPESGKSLRVIEAINPYVDYSRLAVSEKNIGFSCLIYMTNTQTKEIVDYLKDENCSVSLTMDFDLLTNKYIRSSWRCRSQFEYDKTDSGPMTEKYSCIEGKKPMCFWFGSDKVEPKTVTIRTYPME